MNDNYEEVELQKAFSTSKPGKWIGLDIFNWFLLILSFKYQQLFVQD